MKYFIYIFSLLAASNLLASTPAKKALEDYVFANKEGEHLTDAFIILKDDKIVFEKYARGFKKESRHYAWSISKTITGAIIGAAVQKGTIDLKDSIAKYFPNKEVFKEDPKKADITIGNLMDWGSGLDYIEEYENAKSRTDSSVIQQLYGQKAFLDSVNYLLSHKLTDKPGTRFRYTTGDSTLLMGVLKYAYKDNKENFPWDVLFDPMEMNDVTFERDAAGTFVGGAAAWLTARNLIKFGQLYLNNGVYKGKQILPPGWNDFSWSISETRKKTAPKYLRATSQMPGRQWWLNINQVDDTKRRFENIPRDSHMGLGHWGQVLVVIPSENMVIVRFGEDKQRGINRGIMVKNAIDYVKSIEGGKK